MTQLTRPCAQCPWRLSNQGKRHAFGFYTLSNLRRLWNQVRGGGRPQSCHLTDPTHPDHVAVGAKPGSQARECPGSVILVRRELCKMADEHGVIGGDTLVLDRYFKTRRRGLTRRGALYWIVQRIQLAHVPMMNADGPLPDVDDTDVEIGLPEKLRVG